jgi:hypothetical protein
MNLVDLSLTVCLAANPAKCRTERLHFENHGSVLQCMFLAPAEIAKWSELHPALKVVRWTCMYPERGRTL